MGDLDEVAAGSPPTRLTAAMAEMLLQDAAAHRAAVQAMRAQRDAGLRDPTGWLSLVGLHWLRDGEQQFGASQTNDIVLRAEDGDVPPLAGTLELTGGRVLVHPSPGAALTADGRPVLDGSELLDDQADVPTALELASLRLVVIRRGEGRVGLRVKDTSAPALRSFTGLPYFEIDPEWRLTGRLARAEPGATVPVPTVLGDVGGEPTPGVVEFTVRGRPYRLDALESMPGHLWLIFRDGTSGHETYGGGRFLVSGEVQPDDSVEIDFNLAYNPPCVFSPFATCPLPPAGNELPIRIRAGEKVWELGH
jgi:uncharacterized protein (DUF1684 family)